MYTTGVAGTGATGAATFLAATGYNSLVVAMLALILLVGGSCLLAVGSRQLRRGGC